MDDFEEVTIVIKKGDIITSREGILMISSFTGNRYLAKKAQYVGKGFWVVKKKARFSENSSENPLPRK